jgi:hypothetical protein
MATLRVHKGFVEVRPDPTQMDRIMFPTKRASLTIVNTNVELKHNDTLVLLLNYETKDVAEAVYKLIQGLLHDGGGTLDLGEYDLEALAHLNAELE